MQHSTNLKSAISIFVSLWGCVTCLADEAAGTHAFFAGTNAADYRGVWVTDGTSHGTVEIPIGGATGMASRCSFAMLNGKVLFGGLQNSEHHKGLWQTDGTPAGTTELHIKDAPTDLMNNIAGFASLNGKLLFRGSDGLWQTDGTASGTTEISVNGAGLNGVNPSNFALLKGTLLFNGLEFRNRYSLWKTDGSAAGTVPIPVRGASLKGLNPTQIFSPRFGHLLFGLTMKNLPVGGWLLFAGFNNTDWHGLWATDGTSAGTRQIIPRGASRSGLIPAGFGQLGGNLLPGKVLFGGRNAAGRFGLWQTDGTPAGTAEIPVKGLDGIDPVPGNFILFNGKLLFGAAYAHGKYGLWQTDGTPAGTFRIQVSGEAPDFTGLLPRDFALVNGKVLFSGFKHPYHGVLWETDGTAAGTMEIPVNGASKFGFSPSCLTSVGNLVRPNERKRGRRPTSTRTVAPCRPRSSRPGEHQGEPKRDVLDGSISSF
jgi:hypothetical protein